jgi:hypothetical protein
MDLQALRDSTKAAAPPKELSLPLQALWWDAKGEWDRAHECAQQVEDETDGQWVHAYLHRKEGDLSNARYWYRRCGKAPASGALAEEWEAIARTLLKVGRPG